MQPVAVLDDEELVAMFERALDGDAWVDAQVWPAVQYLYTNRHLHLPAMWHGPVSSAVSRLRGLHAGQAL